MLTGLLFILIALFADLPLWLTAVLSIGGGIKVALSLFKYTVKFVEEIHIRREAEIKKALDLATKESNK